MLFDALNFLITLNSLAKSSLERYYGSFLMKCVILLKKEKRKRGCRENRRGEYKKEKRIEIPGGLLKKSLIIKDEFVRIHVYMRTHTEIIQNPTHCYLHNF